MSDCALLTEDETRQVMAPYEDRLAAVLSRAFTRWRSLPPEHALAMSARSRASLIHDYIVDEAGAEFAGDGHVTVTHKRGTVVLVFAGKVAVRFKKVSGDSLRYSVGRTWRQRAIHHQQLALDGTDVRLTWATAGWRLNAAGGLAQTALVVNDGDRQQYAFDLAPADSAEVLALPVRDDDEDGLVIRPAASADHAADGAGTP
ncbi:MAG: hypothetical protein M3P48_04935 [Actinomycetota bacterium]|nr:hypothetical protein [Actinomycetota bacterium]